MDHEVGPWKMVFSHSPISFQKKQFTKSLGPSLGVNWIWTKRDGHAPKSECVDFFYKKNKKPKNDSSTILLSSLVFIFSSSEKKIIKI